MSYPKPYGDYTLLEHLGAGGMSSVELARRTVGDGEYVRFAVIKRILGRRSLEDASTRMFLDEARINAELHHENIAQVYDFGIRDGEFYLVMEYVPGMDLRDACKALWSQDRGLPLRITLTIMDQVLAGLAYAHSAVDMYGRPMKVVHRDVNPRNVMLSTRGDVKLIDFGLAKAEDRVEETVGDKVKGKFAYMAPEQLESGDMDGRTDLFACGMMLQELVSGRDNFHGLGHVQIVHRVLTGQFGEMLVPEGFEGAEALQAIRSRSLEPDQDARYPDAETMRSDLAEAARLAGGLCSRKEVAAFVQGVGGERVSGISDRLEEYRASQVTVVSGRSEAVPPPPVPPPDLVLDSASSATIVSPHREPATPTAPPPAVEAPEPRRRLGIPLALGAVVLAAVGIWLVVGGPADTGSVDTEPATAVTVEEPAPAPAPTPEPTAVAEEPAPAASPRAPATRRQPTSPAPAPVVRPEPVAEPEPEPEPEVAEVVAEPEPEPEVAEPDPEPEPPTEPLAQGFLYVSSRPAGLEVRVDGEAIGRTPIRLHQLDVGTHTVEVIDGATGKQSKESVEVTEGRPARVTAVLE